MQPNTDATYGAEGGMLKKMVDNKRKEDDEADKVPSEQVKKRQEYVKKSLEELSNLAGHMDGYNDLLLEFFRPAAKAVIG